MSGDAQPSEAPAKKKSLTRTSLLLLPAQIVVRAFEGLLPVLMAAWFGHSHATDVYYFAFFVFAFAGSLVFSAYQDSSLVPVLAETRLSDPKGLPRLSDRLGSAVRTNSEALFGVVAPEPPPITNNSHSVLDLPVSQGAVVILPPRQSQFRFGRLRESLRWALPLAAGLLVLSVWGVRRKRRGMPLIPRRQVG